MRVVFLTLLLFYTHIIIANEIPEDDFFNIKSTLKEMDYSDYQNLEVSIFDGSGSGDGMYLVKIQGEKLVFRITKTKNLLESRKIDYQNMKYGEDIGLGPKILYVNSDYNLIVSEFIEGRHISYRDFSDSNIIKLLAKALKKIHSGPKLAADSDIYEKMKMSGKDVTEDKILAFARFNEIKSSMKEAGFKDLPCHNDLHAANIFLKSDNEIRIIDWEYAANSDPFFEIARTSMEYLFDKEQEEIFLKEYFGEPSKLDMARFYLFKQAILFSGIRKQERDDGPVPENLASIKKVFALHNFPFRPESEIVTWRDVSQHALKLFLRNTSSEEYKRAIELVREASS